MRERRTIYPNLAYQYVPRKASSQDHSRIGDVYISAQLTDEQQNTIARAVIDSDIRNYITAEQNLGLFIRKFWLALQMKSTDLLDELGIPKGTDQMKFLAAL